MLATKKCEKCGKDLPSDDYRKTRCGNLEGTCRKCQNKRMRERYRLKYPVVLRQPFLGESPVGLKWCPTCFQFRPHADFSKNKLLKCGLACNCRECQSYFDLKRLYGLTRDEYERTLREQNDSCRICGATFETTGKRFHVDHDHATGKVRGLLCHKCNAALGMFDDNVDRLRKAVEYLAAQGA
jgi:hypothetical protein